MTWTFCLFRSKRKKIRLIECNVKCSLSKKLTSEGTLRQVFYLSEAPSPSMTPYPPPCTLYTYTVYTVYLFTQGGEGES